MKVTEDMHLILVTESGSVYEIDRWKVRRVNESSAKRGDNEFHRLLVPPFVLSGKPVTFVMESLSEYGADDYGNVGGSPVTFRTTTKVTNIRMAGGYDAPLTRSED